MPKPCVLIVGPEISSDLALIERLSNEATLLPIRDYTSARGILEQQGVDLLLLELRKEASFDISLVSTAKQIRPQVSIIVINGEGLADAFARGASDAFPRPYDRELLVERILALVRGTPDL